MAKTLSGPSWVSKFPDSISTNELLEPFKSNVNKFIATLKAAGASVSINATLRPKERAFLMHWSFRVAQEGYDPEKVPGMAGVDIDWVHPDEKGNKNFPASQTAAAMRVSSYDIAFRPVIDTRHAEGRAIDMDISWTASEFKIKDAATELQTSKLAQRTAATLSCTNLENRKT